MGTPTNEPDPFGTPAPPGQAPLPGQFGESGAPGPGYPAVPEQSFPTQTAPALGEAQFGEAQFGEAQFGEAQFGEAQFGEAQFGEAQFGEAQAGSQHAAQAGSQHAAPGSDFAPSGAPGPQFGPGGMSGPQFGPGGMPGAGPLPPPYPFGYASSQPKVSSAVAIVALCLFWVPVAGLVLSIIGLVKTAGGKARGRGLAITALVLSVLVTAAAVLLGAAIASKPSVLDSGCIHGKTALSEQSKQMDADSAKGDTKALEADITTLADDLAKDAAQSKRGDVRAALLAAHDDYAAIASGHSDAGKLNADLNQIDHLCTIGK